MDPPASPWIETLMAAFIAAILYPIVMLATAALAIQVLPGLLPILTHPYAVTLVTTYYPVVIVCCALRAFEEAIRTQ